MSDKSRRGSILSQEVLKRRVVIRNRLGLHARAAGKLRNLAASFQAEIKVIQGTIEANAKSILGLMALEAAKGSTLILTARGEDAKEALDAIVELIEAGFGEDE